ncbi:MAG: hypothetical protein LBI08_02200, partial [Methanomassiliicoccaceae archaeon]|nr:hypothetical protein [Methanomassiliicoccaceae archaeon]
IRRTVAAISSVGHGTADVGDAERALNGEDVSFGIARPDALTLADVVYDNVRLVAPATDGDPRAEEGRFKALIGRTFFDRL